MHGTVSLDPSQQSAQQHLVGNRFWMGKRRYSFSVGGFDVRSVCKLAVQVWDKHSIGKDCLLGDVVIDVAKAMDAVQTSCRDEPWHWHCWHKLQPAQAMLAPDLASRPQQCGAVELEIAMIPTRGKTASTLTQQLSETVDDQIEELQLRQKEYLYLLATSIWP